MKIQLSRKWLYCIPGIIVLAAVIVLFAMDAADDNTAYDMPAPGEGTGEVVEAVPQSAENIMNTVAYYQDDNGYLVPVMRSIRAEQGVAKATLNLMVKSVYNDMEAARLGLRCLIPENTRIDLDISDGTATLDVSGEIMNAPSAMDEYNMVNAIVQTLTDFPTVERVNFLVNGKKTEKLTHGTDVSRTFEKGYMNLESGEAGGSAKAVTLYFTGDSPAMIVPVTRLVYGSNDISTAVLELVKGPGDISPLNRVIPAGCGLKSVYVENGVAYVDFTKEFINIAEESDGGRLALRALVLTCLQFDGVKSVKVLVEGEVYDTGEGTLAKPTFINSAIDIEDAFIREKSTEIFEFE